MHPRFWSQAEETEYGLIGIAMTKTLEFQFISVFRLELSLVSILSVGYSPIHTQLGYDLVPI